MAAARSIRKTLINSAGMLLAIVAVLLLLYMLGARSPEPAVQAVPTPTQTDSRPPQTKATAAKLPHIQPKWTELSASQQQALAPLVNDWDSLDTLRKKKWLEIANKYPKMATEDQQRLQARMHDWVKLTPEQRRLARESYAIAKNLPPDQKSAKWQQYQSLPEEEKKKLAHEAEKKKHVANLPRAVASTSKTKQDNQAPAAMLSSVTGEQTSSHTATDQPVASAPVIAAPPTTTLPENTVNPLPYLIN